MAGAFPRLLDFDRKYAGSIQGYLAGVDEAGRGPLAGPVVAAAVIFRRPVLLPYLNDSKKVTPERRRTLFWQIAQHCLIGVGVVDAAQIDEINIYQASRLAMKQAVLALTSTPKLILIDGPMKLDLPVRQCPIVRGDAQSASIAAASIVAKVYRDEWMCRLDELYPSYGFKTHKGYATEIHLKSLKDFGPCEVHRKSFEPCHEKELFSNLAG